MASKRNLIVDVARCDNCRVCFLAVKDEYVGEEPGPGQWCGAGHGDHGLQTTAQESSGRARS